MRIPGRLGLKSYGIASLPMRGYCLIDGRLQKINKKPSVDVSGLCDENIARHKTAIDRNKLSSPMQSLLRHNYFEGQHSIFDYGCGKGDDLTILRENGIEAKGWDPVYKPNALKETSDIVNLGFV